MSAEHLVSFAEVRTANTAGFACRVVCREYYVLPFPKRNCIWVVSAISIRTTAYVPTSRDGLVQEAVWYRLCHLPGLLRIACDCSVQRSLWAM